MVKQRKAPNVKRQEEAPDVVDDAGVGDHGLDENDDFDHFLETIDESTDSEEDDDEADPAQEGDSDSDTSNDEDEDDEDEEMEPEEQEDLNEDEEEEEGDSNDQESSDDQGVEEEGEEGAPLQNGAVGGEGDSTDESENYEEVGEELTAKKHKMDLQTLQETDPEFFEFLKENDSELLDFDGSDDDDPTDSDEEDSLHKPPETLEEASDSEAEEERFDADSAEHKSKVNKLLKKRIVDLHVISHWQKQLSETRDITVLGNVIDALQCAVSALSQGDTAAELKWRVDGSSNFNALLRLCIKEVKGFCVRFLCGNNTELSENKFDQKPFEVRDKSKSKGKWTKLRLKIKSYMEVMVQLLKCMGNPEAVASILRHCIRMSGFWALLGAKSFKLMRCLTKAWSEMEDTCRVLAFFTIIRITNYSKDIFLLQMFKQMYIAYVANCKFTSINTWPSINFMRSSLVELYLLDTELAYSVAFPFIRQLAIHLRNALSPTTVHSETKLKQSEASRVVYSWQFVHSLHLWVDVLAQAGANEDDNLKLLIHPLVQICMGTVKLIPTKKYIPLRFHIIKMLIKLQEKTGVFIPVLPIIREVLRLTDFSNKSASKFSVRPIDLTCCIRADATETGYVKAVSENVFEMILLYCKAIATDIGYPEIITPTAIDLRRFLKKDCKNVEVSKKFKMLLEKMDANTKYISERRSKAMEEGTVNLSDKKSHKIFKVQLQTMKPHPPLLLYATDYFKMNQRVQTKARRPPLETKEEKLIPKPTASKKSDGRTPKAIIDYDKPMFESNSDESDAEFQTKLDPVPEAKSKFKKLKKRKLQDNEDAELETSDNEKPKKIPKKIKSKNSRQKSQHDINVADVPDELVDFELSD